MLDKLDQDGEPTGKYVIAGEMVLRLDEGNGARQILADDMG